MLDKIKKMRGLFYRKITEKLAEERKIEEIIPGFSLKRPERIVEFPSTKDVSQINVTYPLIEPFAYANIKWDAEAKELVYNLIEPKLTENDAKILQRISDDLVELIEIELSSVKDLAKAIEYLETQVLKIIKDSGFVLEQHQYIVIMYYIYRNFIGFNEIDPLLQDPNIEDISCDGVGTPLYIVHRKYGSMKTNVVFDRIESLREFVIKMAERCGRYVSYAEPILDGTLPDGSRVSATLASDVSTRGASFTIRKFVEKPFSPVEQIELGTASAEILAYYWYLIEHGANILVVGGTATGKTSFLNTLCMFIQPEAKIVSIEDTRELRIPHEHWIPSLARVGFGIPMPTGEKYGEVTLYDLLKESFRQNPDYVVVGETRGKEAYVMFQGMASIPGWEKVAVLNDGHLKRVPIEELEPKKNYLTLTIDPISEKVKILPVKAKIKHAPRTLLYKVITKSGREVVTTPDHSVFTYDGKIKPIRVGELKVGNKVVIPARIPSGFNDVDFLNLIELLPDVWVYAPNLIEKAVEILGSDLASKSCEVKSISDYSNFKRSKPSALLASKFLKLMEESGIEYRLEDLNIRFLKKSKNFPAKFKITPEFLRLLGYYVSEGSLNQSGRISLYNQDETILEDMRNCIKAVAGSKIRERKISRGFSWVVELAFSHKVLFELLKRLCGKNSRDRKIPDFVFGLSKEKIGEFLTGLYAGDGWYSRDRSRYVFGYSTRSKQLANDLLYLLLTFGIIGVADKKRGDIHVVFCRRQQQEEFLKFVKPMKTDIKFEREGKEDGRVKNDIFLDEIKKIEKLRLKGPVSVFDLSVSPTENFIGGFGGVMLHNSGHPSLSTFHAGSVETVVKRLTTPPIELSPTLIESLDVITVMVHAKEKEKSARRIKEVVEIESIDPKTGDINTNVVFKWNPVSDSYEKVNESIVVRRIVEARGGSYEDALTEIERRAKVLRWMSQQGMKDYLDVTKVINSYYKEPKKVLESIGEKLTPRIEKVEPQEIAVPVERRGKKITMLELLGMVYRKRA
jgi:type IV secretory pathway ATPase VirB11/archaellum biosynthesis ATPase/intein/homing endonuclease